MDSALQSQLYDKYPDLYPADRNDPRKSCMFWGVDVGNGWYDLLDRTFDKLTKLKAKNLPHTHNIRLAQVKEKFGTLRIYLSGGCDGAYEIVDKAETESEKICETCGQPGAINNDGWVRVICDACEVLRKEERERKEKSRE